MKRLILVVVIVATLILTASCTVVELKAPTPTVTITIISTPTPTPTPTPTVTITITATPTPNISIERQTELHDIQTAVMAMLADSITGQIVPVTDTHNMSAIKTTDTATIPAPLVLTAYLTMSIINPDGTLKNYVYLRCGYSVTADGTVTQIQD
jgi:hypothetical protein